MDSLKSASKSRSERDPRDIRWLILGFIILAVFLWGTLHPTGAHWGFHALSYFPFPVQIGVFLLAALLLVLSSTGIITFSWFSKAWAKSSRFSPWMEILIGIVAFICFYSYHIQGVAYGDSRRMLEWYKNNQQFDPHWITQVFKLNPFSSKEALTTLLHRSAAYLFDIPIDQAYRILSALAGGAFVTTWLLLVRRRSGDAATSLLLILSGLFCGGNAVFFGEIENYAFTCFSWELFLTGATLYFDRALKWFWVLPLFFLAAKAHGAGLTFLPAMMFLLLYHLRERWAPARAVTRIRGLLFAIVLPFIGAGLAFYIWLGAYKEPYAGPPERIIHRSFLPVLASPPPLDHYTIASWYHALDLFNIVALVTIPASVLLLGCGLWHRRETCWSDPKTLFFLVAFLFPGLFYFAVNPMLTMPRDWDIYAPLGMPVLFLLAAVLPSRMPRTAIALAACLGTFSIFFFALNANAERLSYRIVDAGHHAFQTYHSGAAYFTRLGIVTDPNPQRAMARLKENQVKLRSMAHSGDQEFADETCWLATLEMQAGRTASAEALLKEAAEVSPRSLGPHAMLADIALRRGQVTEAGREITTLLELNPAWAGGRVRAVQFALLTADSSAAALHLAVLDSLAKDDAITKQLHKDVSRRWPE
jgi:tetratricopeptide repeat protein